MRDTTRIEKRLMAFIVDNCKRKEGKRKKEKGKRKETPKPCIEAKLDHS